MRKQMNTLRSMWEEARLELAGITEDRLRRAIENSRLQYTTLGDLPHLSLPHDRLIVLVGVASSSQYDLAFLEALDEVLESCPSEVVSAHVFSLDCPNAASRLRELFPELGTIWTGPLVSIRRAGQLVESSYGWPAKRAVRAHLEEHVGPGVLKRLEEASWE